MFQRVPHTHTHPLRSWGSTCNTFFKTKKGQSFPHPLFSLTGHSSLNIQHLHFFSQAFRRFQVHVPLDWNNAFDLSFKRKKKDLFVIYYFFGLPFSAFFPRQISLYDQAWSVVALLLSPDIYNPGECFCLRYMYIRSFATQGIAFVLAVGGLLIAFSPRLAQPQDFYCLILQLSCSKKVSLHLWFRLTARCLWCRI